MYGEYEKWYEITFIGKFGCKGTCKVYAYSEEEAKQKFEAEEWSCIFLSIKEVKNENY